MSAKYIGGKVEDLSGWHFCGEKPLNDFMADVFGEVLSNSLYNDEAVDASWPMISRHSDGYDGPPISDPLVIMVALYAFANDFPPRYRINVRDVIMDDCREVANGNYFDTREDELAMLKATSDALRKLADEIDALPSSTA